MVDCVGKELSIGDKVVCADMKYADLLIGEIVGFTPKKVRVVYKRSGYGEAYGVKGQKEQLKESYQIFKYEEVVQCKNCTMWERDRISCEGLARCLTGEGGTRYRGRNDFCSIGIKMEGKDAG